MRKLLGIRIIEIGVISLISLGLVFGLVKIVEAPFKEFFQYLTGDSNNEEIKPNGSLATPDKRAIEFIFGGDVMLSRQVNSRMVKYNDFNWPFLKIANFLRAADLTVVNLESPFILANDYNVPTGSFMFKANPRALDGLILAGIDIVSLANNHTLNQGEKGLKETFKILTEKGIKYLGAGNSEEEARRGEVIEIYGDKFSFLSYAYPDDNSVATNNRAGIATMDIEKMTEDVKREIDKGNKVIVIMHAGTEYVTKPNWQQKDFARASIDAGVEAVIGHHPHWPQTFEFYKNKPIIYSLGNLVFDQMWSLETQEGLLAKMTWRDGWEKIELVPIKIYDYGQPEIIIDEKERLNIFKKIGAPDNGIILKI